ncbi:MAG: tyrosine-protein kinase family protein, partial [Actinomycetota bacterium]
IVDANMREPELHKAFKLSQTPGLADVLTGKAELQIAAVPTRVPNLSLLPAGKPSVPAQALLGHQALGGLFQAMRGRFDLIVVDTPPILQYPDALHIGKCVDGVLLVVSPNGASRREQQQMRRLFDRVEARILGMVLNRVPPRERSPLAGAS